jgi:hypothetical protein
MKTLTTICLALATTLASSTLTRAQPSTNLDPAASHAFAENLGWVDWQGPGQGGAHVDGSFLRGRIWSESVGWIELGQGPADGAAYANEDGADCGVNLNLGTGALSGLAWGENIGWVNFDTASAGEQRARLLLDTLQLAGFAWGENVGWIGLDGLQLMQAATPFAQGIAGADGKQPMLRAYGLKYGGTSNTLALTGARPDSIVGFYFSLTQQETPFKGGFFYPMPVAFAWIDFADEDGAVGLSIQGFDATVPFSLFVQCAMFDPEAAHGISASNPIEYEMSL